MVFPGAAADRLILGEHVGGRLTFAGHVDGPHDRLVDELAGRAGRQR